MCNMNNNAVPGAAKTATSALQPVIRTHATEWRVSLTALGGKLRLDPLQLRELASGNVGYDSFSCRRVSTTISDTRRRIWLFESAGIAEYFDRLRRR
ncbi:MAG: hypothetical protein HC774_00995 [Sphingomonadales bacterium]|nr:hypothetical protein [Sphingomonadales bacterium]